MGPNLSTSMPPSITVTRLGSEYAVKCRQITSSIKNAIE